jgi:hypothetical protein
VLNNKQLHDGRFEMTVRVDPFAKELHSDLAYGIIKNSEQLTPIVHQRFASSVQRHQRYLRSAVPRFVKGSLGFEIAYLTFDSKWASQKAV